MSRFIVALLLCIAASRIADAQSEQTRVSAPQISADNGPEAVNRARTRGAQRAADDIKADRAVILYYGEPWSVGKPLVDDATGLPVQVVGGCDVTQVFVAEVAAYNEAVRAWHAQKNPPRTP